MTRKIALWALVLLTGGAHSAWAQTPQAFKAGDFVEAHLFSQWLPCTVFRVNTNSLVPSLAGQITDYTVTCLINGSAQESSVVPTAVRARAATADDKGKAAETAIAKGRQPKGNSPGAKYGTREPRTCASVTAPGRGAPSAEQAAQYVICGLERGDGSHPELLVVNVKVQVAPVAHATSQPLEGFTTATIDLNQPAWDIRGSFTTYTCYALSSLIAQNDFARTHNCDSADVLSATGYCYKDVFGGWHCGMSGVATNSQANVLPPYTN